MNASGNLFGTTEEGGAHDSGTVFELPKGGTINTLASFGGANGQNPEAALIMDSSGNLYGTTSLGGAANDGTVFEVVAGSDVLSTLARRAPQLAVIIYPSPVQGAGASAQLIAALQAAVRRSECDVLLLVRGGGSIVGRHA